MRVMGEMSTAARGLGSRTACRARPAAPPVVGGPAVGACVLVLALALAVPARASVEGTAPAKVGTWRLFGAHSATGAALLVPGPYVAEVNSVLLPSATAQITDLPYDAEVKAAYLFWSGAAPRTSRAGAPDPPDRDVDFTLADGTFYNDLSVDSDLTGFGRCVTTSALGGFYYCRRNVTDLVRAQGMGNANGIYSVGGLQADAGTLSYADPQWVNAQAKYAAFALVLVWSAPSETVRRDVVLYDGFLRLDEDATAGIHTFQIDGFQVGSPALGRFTVLGLEGDRQLGVPPQDLTGCPTCYDYISFKGTKLSDGANPANNSFNSSWNGQASLDIDTYNLVGLINTGDTTASIEVGSGDGIPGHPQGGGESFFVGWVVMTVDTLTPNFAGTSTRLRVTPSTASGGQTLFYTIDVVNQGSLAATNVVLTNAMPAGTTYVAGSTRIDGTPVADVSGHSPLTSGLLLATIPTAQGGDNSRQVTFSVRVNDSACGGPDISDSATLSATEIEPQALGPATTHIVAVALDAAEKTVDYLSAPPYGPGTVVDYVISVGNPQGFDIGGVRITDALPAYLVVTSVIVPSGAKAAQSGGTLSVTDLTVPAHGTASVQVLARVFSQSEFVAAGVAEDAIDGLIIANRATISGGCSPALDTDDPEAPGIGPTEIALSYAPSLAASSKTALDVNGAPLEPNDRVRFTVRVVNFGNRAADVTVTDAIPANTQYVVGSTRVDGVPLTDVGGTSALVGGTVLASVGVGSARTLTFETVVDTLVTNGSLVQNSALLHPQVAPAHDVTVSSAPLVVVAAPKLDTSTKAVVDRTAAGSYAPGDEVEYTVTARNTGNRPASAVVVTDVVPVELGITQVLDGGSASGAVVTWTLPTLAAGASRTLRVRAVLATPLDNGTLVSNEATLACLELPSFVTPAVQFVVHSSPLVVVTKVDEHPRLPARPGDAVTYRLRLRNDGTMVARHLLVSDPIDAALTAAAAPSGVVSLGQVTWDEISDTRLAALAPGAGNAVELVFSAALRTPLDNATVVANQTTVQIAGFPSVLSDDPDVAGSADPTTFTVAAQAALVMSKQVTDLSPSTPWQPGEQVRYDLVLVAAGDAPTRNIVVTDLVPVALGGIDATASGGSFTAGQVTWGAAGNPALARLDPGAQVTLSFVATLAVGTPDGTVVSNQASAQSPDLGAAVASDGDLGQAGEQPTAFTVVSRPLLRLAKSVAPATAGDTVFNPGDLVRYTLRITNAGTATATNLVLSDTVPAHLTVADAGGGQLALGQLTFAAPAVASLAIILPGATVALAFTATLERPLDNGTTVSNQASLSAAEVPTPVLSDDPALPGPSDATVFAIVSACDFSATSKTVVDLSGDPLVTRPGDSLRYTIVVENRGDQNADHVVVEDLLPTGVSASVPPNARLVGSTIVWDATSEPALALVAGGNGKVTLTFDATVAAGLVNGTSIANQASVKSDEVTTPVLSDDPVTVAVDDPTRVSVVSSADLGGSSMVVTDTQGAVITQAKPSQVVRYHLVISNRGDGPATSVVVTDVLDSRLVPVAALGGTVSGQSVTFASASTPALATLAPGASVDLYLDARLARPLANGLVLATQASIAAVGVADPVLTDFDVATLPKEPTPLSVDSRPDVSLSTKVFVDPLTALVVTTRAPGEAVRVLITVRNSGDAPAVNVNVRDVLDTAVLTDLVVRDGGTLGAGLATWTLASVVSDTELRVDARLRQPLDAGVLVNQAFLGIGAPPTLPTDDPSAPGASDATRLTIISAPALTNATLDVTGDYNRTALPGNRLTYTLRFASTGTANAHGVVVEDTLPVGLSFVSADNGGALVGSLLRWTLGDVVAGQSKTLTFVADVAPGAVDGSVLDNQATLRATGLADLRSDDPDTAAPLDVTRVTVDVAPLSFTKTVALVPPASVPGLVRPGDAVRYTLRVKNEGTATASDFVIRDPIDSMKLVGVLTDVGGTFSGTEVVYTGGPLGPGATATFSVEANIAMGLADGTVIENQATVLRVGQSTPTWSDAEPSTPGVADPTRLLVAYPALQLNETFVDKNAGDVSPGDELTFTLAVHNAGSILADTVAVSTPLDSHLELVSAPDATLSNASLLWTMPALAPASTTTLTFTARVRTDTAHGTEITSQAQAVTTGLPLVVSDWPATPTPLDPVRLRVVAVPALLGVTKIIATSASEHHPGDLVTYRITVPNSGSGPATNLVVRDPLDSHLEFVAARSSGAFDVGTRVVRWDVGRLAAGANVTLEVDVRIAASTQNGALVQNQAFVRADEIALPVVSDDPGTSAVGDATALSVSAQAGLNGSTLAVVDLDGGAVQPGDRLRYVLRVVNNGNAAAEQATARLAIPSFLHYVAGTTALNGQALADQGARSAVVQGITVQSPGAAPGTLVAKSAAGPAGDGAAEVTFEARVDPYALVGTLVSAQALLGATGLAPTASDDPSTAAVAGDATVVVVGGGARLAVSKQAQLVVDGGVAGQAEVGDTLRYRITVASAGQSGASQAALVDVLPSNVALVPGSVRLNGTVMSESADGDAATLDGQTLRVGLGDLAPTAALVVEFDAAIRTGPYVSNQAEAQSAGTSWLSDGDPSALGEQPTVTAVAGAPLVVATLAAEDLDGGNLEPGDAVRLVLSATNAGVVDLADLTFVVDRPVALVGDKLVVGGDGALQGERPPTWRLAALGAGKSARVEYEATVASATPIGTSLDIGGHVNASTVVFESEVVHLLVGVGSGAGAVTGRVFREPKEHNRSFDEGADEPLAGFSVAVVPEARLLEQERQTRDVSVASLAVRAVTTAHDGIYRSSGVPAGRYRLIVTTAEGVEYARSASLDIAAGKSGTADFAIDPSGIVYEDVDGAAVPVAGARVYLVDSDTGTDLSRTALQGGQQGQVTTAQGFYRFDVRSTVLPGRFALRVEPPTSTLIFPSTLRAPVGASEADRLGVPADVPASGRIVESSAPDLADPHYYLRFALDATSPNVTNNHVPLDRLSQLIRLTKSANRRTAEVGDILTYTVTAENPTDVGIDLLAGGVTVRDELPAGLTRVDADAWRSVVAGGSLIEATRFAPTRQDGAPRVTFFGPFALLPHSTTTLRYYAVVGLRARGEQRNRAQLLAGTAAISPEASATVRVVADPLFDEGTVLGRVFCDDGDGELGPEEAGLPGARVFLDTGYYVNTDSDGKFHFRGVPPGRHLVKLDLNTAPPGARPTTDVRRDFMLTRGLLAKIDFGVTCGLELARPESVSIKGGSQSAVAVPAPSGTAARIVVDRTLLAVSLDGVAQPLPLVDAVLARGDDKPDFASATGLACSAPTALVWHFESAGRAAVAEWQLSVFGDDGVEVWRVVGNGEPPPRLPWELGADGSPLAAGHSYLYRVAAKSTAGDLAEGRWRALALAAGATPASATPAEASGKPETLITWRGAMFKDGTAEPKPELVAKVKEFAPSLAAAGDAALVIEVHANDDPKRSANLMLSQRQALAVRALLVESGVTLTSMQPVGKGDTEPLMPPINKKAREFNRRIVVAKKAAAPIATVVAMQSAVESPPQPSYGGWLEVSDVPSASAAPRVEASVEAREGEAVVVDVRLADGKRVRVSRRFPFGVAEAAAQRTVDVPIEGSLGETRLVIGGAAVPLPLLAAECAVKGDVPPLGSEGLAAPLRFTVGASVALASRQVRVLNPDGSLLAELEPQGASDLIEWTAKSERGASIVRAGTYTFRCVYADDQGSRAVSAAQTFVVGSPRPSEALHEKVLAGDLYPAQGAIIGAAAAALDNVVASALAVPGSRLVVEVYDDGAEGKLQAQIKTARLAGELRAYLLGKGVPEGALMVSAFGAGKPIMPGDSRRARALNRRVQVKLVSSGAAAGGETPEPRVRAAGQLLTVGADGSFAGTLKVASDARFAVDLALPDGRSVLQSVVLFNGRPESAATGVPRAFAPQRGASFFGSAPSLLGATSPSGALAKMVASDVRGEQRRFKESVAGGEGVDAVSGWRAEMPERVVSPSGPAALVAPSAPAPRVEPSGPAPLVPASEASGRYVQFVEAAPGPLPALPAGAASVASGSIARVEPAAAAVTAEAAAALGAHAGDLFVYLPAAGTLLPGERLTVRGRTDALNKVTVNGTLVDVDAYGRFVAIVKLAPGAAKVEVTSEDADGNVARLERDFIVPDSEWFLLALADGVAGVGGKLDGMNADTTRDFDNPLSQGGPSVYVHGRAVAYFKGRIKGEALLAGSPFQDIRVTAHVDTGKEREAQLLRQLIDPERYYPVYGDGAEERQDVTSRGKVYVLLQADKSRLTIGSFKTMLRGLELFRYDRSLYGVALDVDHELVAGQRSELHALAASGDEGVRTERIVLQGTGGSLYFLRHGTLIEGTERVEIVVRDAATGTRLVSVPQRRDFDYRIDYRNGRVTMAQPVPSAVMSGFRVNQHPLRNLDGQPVFLEVSYDYSSLGVGDAESSLAVQARQTFFDRLALGAGVVQEDRSKSGGPHYRLYGGDLHLSLGQSTRLDAEVAYSQAEDGDHLASYDGGITFARLGSPERFSTNAAGASVPVLAKGFAAKAQLSGDLGELFGVVPEASSFVAGPQSTAASPLTDMDPATTPAGRAAPSNAFLPYALYVQHQDPWFYSNTGVFEQGQTKFGGQLRAVLSAQDSIKLRHDAVWSRLFVTGEERRATRQLSALGYERDGNGWKAGLELGNTYAQNQGQAAVDAGFATVYGERRLMPRLVGFLEQQGIAGGDARLVHSTPDRFATTAGARYKLNEALWLSASEIVRWSGTNSTQLGLKADLGEELAFYASERLTAGDGRPVSTTVVGGESHAIPGSRSYGEYQLDSLVSGRSGRAVLGMDNRWSVAEGLQLNLSYERSQILGVSSQSFLGPSGSALSDPRSLGVGTTNSITPAGFGSGPLTGAQQFSASGYSSAGVFPVGVASRDAFAIGLEYLRSRTFKAGARFELRYDRGDAQLGAPDRLVLYGMAGSDWRFERSLVLLGRVQGAAVQNQDLKFAEGQFLDVSLGLALRPVHSNGYAGLAKWTRRLERRAVTPDGAQYQLETSDVLALEPVFELGYGLQAVGKAAIKLKQVLDAQLPQVTSTTVLALARLNYHVTDEFDVGAEYRWLANMLIDEVEHGALVEVAWLPVEYVAVGVGWNFTRFSDDLLASAPRDEHGFFLRVTGRY